MIDICICLRNIFGVKSLVLKVVLCKIIEEMVYECLCILILIIRLLEVCFKIFGNES